jgi:quercetin dioxygenase-like cupin family protein
MLTRTTFSLVVAMSLAVMTAATRPATAQGQAHPMLTPADVKWGPAPPVLPPGAQVAVLDGDPFKPGFFSMRLKMPDGYKVAPHWHPTDENIVVLQGTFNLGMGDAANTATAKAMPAGSFAKMPKEMRHYALAKGETVIQIYGDGPFVVNYVNPKDDPSKKPTGR